jgi:hypothetical protein
MYEVSIFFAVVLALILTLRLLNYQRSADDLALINGSQMR